MLKIPNFLAKIINNIDNNENLDHLTTSFEDGSFILRFREDLWSDTRDEEYQWYSIKISTDKLQVVEAKPYITLQDCNCDCKTDTPYMPSPTTPIYKPIPVTCES